MCLRVYCLLCLLAMTASCGGRPDPYGQQVNKATDLALLGEERLSQGDLKRATRAFEQALDLSRGIDYALGVAQQLNNLGAIALERGDLDQARELFRQALRLNREIGSGGGVSINLANLATLAQKQGQTSQAGEFLQEALDNAVQANSPGARARILCQMAGLARDQGDLATAQSRLHEAQPLMQSATALQGPCRYQWGRLSLAQGDPATAAGHFEAALAADRQLLARGGMAADLMGLGEAQAALGDWDRAFSFYARAFDIYTALKQPSRLTECFAQLSRVNTQGGLGYDLKPFAARLPQAARPFSTP